MKYYLYITLFIVGCTGTKHTLTPQSDIHLGSVNYQLVPIDKLPPPTTGKLFIKRDVTEGYRTIVIKDTYQGIDTLDWSHIIVEYKGKKILLDNQETTFIRKLIEHGTVTETTFFYDVNFESFGNWFETRDYIFYIYNKNNHKITSFDLAHPNESESNHRDWFFLYNGNDKTSIAVEKKNYGQLNTILQRIKKEARQYAH